MLGNTPNEESLHFILGNTSKEESFDVWEHAKRRDTSCRGIHKRRVVLCQRTRPPKKSIRVMLGNMPKEEESFHVGEHAKG